MYLRFSYHQCILTALLVVIVKSSKNSLIVETENGKVQGGKRNSIFGREYYAYNGIPYAKQPIGDLRFEPPVPAENWSGILKGPKNMKCPQYGLSRMFEGDESCLVLNVYTPRLPVQNSADKLPVMVYIHGGGFEFGSGEEKIYGANRILDRDVVLVTINYRLDALGFISTEDDVLPGNYGLLDQVTALQWVQKNVDKFGGNPSKVTIFGASAGGVAVNHLLLSPKAKGLFHAAIAQSGASLCDTSIQKKAKQNARKLAAKLNCPTHPSIAIKNCLKNRTAFEILTKDKEFKVVSILPVIMLPVIEKTQDGFFPDDLQNLVKQNLVPEVPIIMGLNEKEGISAYYIMDNYCGVRGEKFLKDEMPEMVSLLFPGAKDKGQEIINEYFKELNANDSKIFRDTMVDIYSESFTACMVDMVKLLVQETTRPVYVYRFTHRGNKSRTTYSEYLGVDHGDDLLYLFSNPFFGNLSEPNTKMSNIMLDMWTNFATYHNPTPNGIGNDQELKWLTSEKDNFRYLELDLDPAMISGIPVNHAEFWTSIQSKVN